MTEHDSTIAELRKRISDLEYEKQVQGMAIYERNEEINEQRNLIERLTRLLAEKQRAAEADAIRNDFMVPRD